MQLKHLLALIFLASCTSLFIPVAAPVVSRPIQYLPGSSFDSSIQNGLTTQERRQYYSMDEGIQWLPTDVLMSLKRPIDSGFQVMDELLLARPERFGLLPNYVNPQSDIPIGITISTDSDYTPMSGIACPACHTSMISNAQGQFFLIDGASSRFAADRFLGEMIKSLVATLINPIEFEAFYARYRSRVVADETPEDTGMHRAQIAALVQKSYTIADVKELKVKLNTLPKMITNKITSLDEAYPTAQQLSTKLGMYVYLAKRFITFFGQTKYGTNSVANMSEAGLGRSNPWSPTSKMLLDRYLHQDIAAVKTATVVNTPYVWDFDRQHWIFLMGQTNSLVERNVIQGIALLSDFNPTTFETTVSIKKLQGIVEYGKKIHAPIWPESILGTIDRDLASRGRVLFQEQCLSCHNPQSDHTATASANYDYFDVGTDPTYYQVQVEQLYGKDLFSGIVAPFMIQVKKKAMQVEGLTVDDMTQTYETNRLPVIWKAPTGNNFEAKPLAGAWATPPYLHNGSVPTVWDLLQTASARPAQFHIGGFVYDSKKLGYVEDKTLPDGFDIVTTCATGCLGNSNAGHEFGVTMSDDDKWALIEFLKSYTAETSL